jgi:hypothetical protein
VTVAALRRLLSRKVSIEAMLEFAMWIAIPYLVVGIVWTFLNADDVARGCRTRGVRSDDRAVAVPAIRPRGLRALIHSRP